MKGEIGIVIATYNGENYIKEQLESIINQAITPDYILVSDGGSSDNTVNICEETLLRSKIKYDILKTDENLGVKDNFEKCLKNCDTKYIFFSDQDDYWLPNKIKNAMNIFYKEQPNVVFNNAYITDENLKAQKKSLWENIGYKNKNKINIYNQYDLELQKELFRHNIMTGMCMAIDSKIKNDIIPFSNYSIHDIWIAHISNCVGKVVSIDSKDVLYRQHGNNVVGTKSTIKNSLKHKDKYLHNLKNRYKFIEEIVSRIKMEKDFYNNYINYKKYLNKRIDFIEKKSSFFNVIVLLKDYFRYEYKSIKILTKDIFTRINYKKGENE